MKNIIFICFVIFSSLLFADCTKNTAYGMPYVNYNLSSFEGLDLKNIESRIYNTFVQSLLSQKEDELSALRDSLTQMGAKNDNPLIKYWTAYLQYYYSIYKIKIGDQEGSKAEIEKGIEIMESIKSKNSEDYALLSMLQSFSIQFKEGMMAGMASGKVKKNVEKAIELDSENLRAFYVAATNDYYTPKKYGGGEKAEEYLLKAVKLPDQKVPNEYLPSWGKETAYELLIKLYIEREKWENAKKYYQEAAGVFPESYVINGLAPKLVGK